MHNFTERETHIKSEDMKRTILSLLGAAIMLANPAESMAQTDGKGIRIIDDVPFHKAINEKGINEELKLDVYLPETKGNKPAPVILWFHGGGLRPGNDKKQSYIVELSKEYARKGYVCVAADYRVREEPKADFQAAVEDALSDATKALEWVVENAENCHIDLNNFYVAGGSAGGWLGVNLMARYPELLKTRNVPKEIRGYISLWGALDQKEIFSPVTEQFPPVLLIHGTEDKSVPVENSIKLDKKLKELGVYSTLFLIDGAGHTPMSHSKYIVEQIDLFLHSTRK